MADIDDISDTEKV